MVNLDVKDYEKGVEELRHSVVGRLFLPRGHVMLTTMELKAKLVSVWGLENFRLILMGETTPM